MAAVVGDQEEVVVAEEEEMAANIKRVAVTSLYRSTFLLLISRPTRAKHCILFVVICANKPQTDSPVNIC